MSETSNVVPLMQQVPQQTDVARLIGILERTLADPSIPLDRVERMQAMIKDAIAWGAELAFNNGMRNAQAEMPAVLRDASNPQTQSRYATLEALIATISETVTKNGFGASFSTFTSTLENHYGIKCYLSHVAGHTREYQVDVPADLLGPKGTPNKSATHGFGSTMTYGRRYLLLLIFNIALTNEDTDGNNISGEKITEEQIAELRKMLNNNKKNEEAFLNVIELKQLSDIYAASFQKCVDLIEAKKAAKAKVKS